MTNNKELTNSSSLGNINYVMVCVGGDGIGKGISVLKAKEKIYPGFFTKRMFSYLF